MRHSMWSIPIVVAALASIAASEGISFPLRSGDVVRGYHLDTDGPHRYDVQCVVGTVLTVRALEARAPTREPQPRQFAPLTITSPSGETLADLLGSRGRPVQVRCTETGTYHVVADRRSEWTIHEFAYAFEVKAASPRRFAPPPVSTDESGVGSVRFSASAGSIVTASLRTVEPSSDRPFLRAVVLPDGTSLPFRGPASRPSITLPVAGDFRLEFAWYREGGPVAVRIDVRDAPPSRRRVEFAEVEPFGYTRRTGIDVAATQEIGPEGGTLDVRSGAAAGASVQIVPDAGFVPRTLFVGTDLPVTPSEISLVPAGPPVLFGPASVFITGGALVTIPYDAARVAGTPRVFERFSYDGFGYQQIAEATIVAVGATTVTVTTHQPGTLQVFGGAADPHAQKIVPTDVAAADRFGGTASGEGTPVAAGGSTIAVGAPQDGAAGARTGSVRILTRTGDVVAQAARLVAPDAQSGDGFGAALAMSRSGDTLVVGTEAAEAVYVYVNDGASWKLDARLESPEPAFGQRFGHSVAVDGDTVVVGAEGFRIPYYGGYQDAGAAWVFVRDAGTWRVDGRLDGYGRMGHAVAISGDTVLVSAPDAKSYFLDFGGAVMVFERDAAAGWRPAGVLTPTLFIEIERFGTSVALDGDRAVVTSRDVGRDIGPVFAFARSSGVWRCDQSLLTPNGLPERFAGPVALAGDTAVVGGVFRYEQIADPGTAVVYRREPTGWAQRGMFEPTSPHAGDAFGFGVAVSGPHVVVTSPGDDDAARDAGAAYSYELPQN